MNGAPDRVKYTKTTNVVFRRERVNFPSLVWVRQSGILSKQEIVSYKQKTYKLHQCIVNDRGVQVFLSLVLYFVRFITTDKLVNNPAGKMALIQRWNDVTSNNLRRCLAVDKRKCKLNRCYFHDVETTLTSWNRPGFDLKQPWIDWHWFNVCITMLSDGHF